MSQIHPDVALWEFNVPNDLQGACSRAVRHVKETGIVTNETEIRKCVKVEVAVPNSPYGLCGRKATLN